MTRETYDRVTRVPGSFDKCMDGIARLLERGIPLTLKTMALAWNHHEIQAMRRVRARASGSCSARQLAQPARRLRRQPQRRAAARPRAQALALDLGNPERMQDFRDFCERPFAAARPRIRRRAGLQLRRRPQLLHGRSLRPAADVPALAQELPRPEARPLRAGLARALPELRARTWQKNEVCRKCSLMSLCGSCPGAAEMETGDTEAWCPLLRARAPASLRADGRGAGHRRDATCCFGTGALAARPDAESRRPRLSGRLRLVRPRRPRPSPLIQLERRPADSAA